MSAASPGFSRTLAGLIDEAWRRLERGADGEGAARFPVLATVGRSGAEARTVVLRSADRAAARLEMHADVLSAKVGELARVAGASLLVWDAEAALQIRVRVRVAVLTGGDVAETWRRMPPPRRQLYGGSPPGTHLSDPSTARRQAEADRFAVLSAEVLEIDLLHLGADPHRRARYRAADAFSGAWIGP